MTSSYQNMMGRKKSTQNDGLDYFPTPPMALTTFLTELIINHYKLLPDYLCWEPACGDGRLSEILKTTEGGRSILSTDIVHRGYVKQDFTWDFFDTELIMGTLHDSWTGDILTNPPFKLAEQFLHQAMKITGDTSKIYLLLRSMWQEGKGRYARIFSVYPPDYIYQASGRIKFTRGTGTGGGMVPYSWFIWDKSIPNEGKETKLRWFNYD